MDELVKAYAAACRTFRQRHGEYAQASDALRVLHREVEVAREAKIQALWALEAAAESEATQ